MISKLDTFISNQVGLMQTCVFILLGIWIAKDMKYIFPLILLVNVLLGQYVLIKTKQKKYLARKGGTEPQHGKDYNGGGPGLNQCSLKDRGQVAEGAMVQKTVQL